MNTSTIARICQEYAGNNGELCLHYDGYTEPGYTDPESGIVATGDWNSRTVKRRVLPETLPSWLSAKDPNALFTVQDETMPRIAVIFKKLGIEVEWEDEWYTCNDCNKLVRTQPDSYSWLPSYYMYDGGVQCEDCILKNPTAYLEDLEGNSRKALTMQVDLEEAGYTRLGEDGEDYASGLYGGQCDDPAVIVKELEKQGISRYIFEITDSGQFDTHFAIWVNNDELPRLASRIESKGHDPAEAMKAALGSI